MIYYTSFKTGRYDKLLSLFFKDTVEEISNGWIKIKTTCEEFYTENYLILENKDKIVYVLNMIIKFFKNNKFQHIEDEEYDEFNKQFIAKFKV